MDRVAESTEGVVAVSRRVLRAEVRASSVGIGLVLAVMLPLFRLWELRPRVPILYHGDAVLTMGAFKNMLLGGWYSSSDLLGVPYGQDLRDFPAVGDLLHLIVSWCLVMVTRDPVLAFNVFDLWKAGAPQVAKSVTTFSASVGAQDLGIFRLELT